MSRKHEKRNRFRWQQRPSELSNDAARGTTPKDASSQGRSNLQSTKMEYGPRNGVATFDRRLVGAFVIVLSVSLALYFGPGLLRRYTLNRLIKVAPAEYQSVLASRTSERERLLDLATIPETQDQALSLLMREPTSFSSWPETREWARRSVDTLFHSSTESRRATMVFLEAMGSDAGPFMKEIGLATADPEAAIGTRAFVMAEKLDLDFTSAEFVAYATPILEARVLADKGSSGDGAALTDERIVKLLPSVRLLGKIAPQSPSAMSSLIGVVESPCHDKLFQFTVRTLEEAMPEWLDQLEDKSVLTTTLAYRLQGDNFDVLLLTLKLAQRVGCSSFELIERIVPLTCHHSDDVQNAAFTLLTNVEPDLLSRGSEAMLGQLDEVIRRVKAESTVESSGQRLGRALSYFSESPHSGLFSALVVRLSGVEADEQRIIMDALEIWTPEFRDSEKGAIVREAMEALLADADMPGITVLPNHRRDERYILPNAQIDRTQPLISQQLVELCALEVCEAAKADAYWERYEKWKEQRPEA